MKHLSRTKIQKYLLGEASVTLIVALQTTIDSLSKFLQGGELKIAAKLIKQEDIKASLNENGDKKIAEAKQGLKFFLDNYITGDKNFIFQALKALGSLPFYFTGDDYPIEHPVLIDHKLDSLTKIKLPSDPLNKKDNIVIGAYRIIEQLTITAMNIIEAIADVVENSIKIVTGSLLILSAIVTLPLDLIGDMGRKLYNSLQSENTKDAEMLQTTRNLFGMGINTTKNGIVNIFASPVNRLTNSLFPAYEQKDEYAEEFHKNLESIKFDSDDKKTPLPYIEELKNKFTKKDKITKKNQQQGQNSDSMHLG